MDDGSGNPATATLTIILNGANDAPVGNDALVSGSEDVASVSGNAVATDVDHADTLTYALVHNSVKSGADDVPDGTITFNANGSFGYAPTAADQALDDNESRQLTFKYTASDGTLTSAEKTITITVNGANDAPVTGGAASFAITEDDAPLIGHVPAASDADTHDQNRLTYSLITGSVKIDGATPPNGDAAVTFHSDGSFSYDPGPDNQGLDTGESRAVTFDYVASDGTVSSVARVITISVAGVNDAPAVTTSAGAAAFVEGDHVPSLPVVIDPAITVSDVDDDAFDSARAQITGNLKSGEDLLAFINTDPVLFGDIDAARYDPALGALDLFSAGEATAEQWQSALQAVTYTNTSVTPDASTRTISFTVDDGETVSPAATRQVSVQPITVDPINEAPVNHGTDGTLTLIEDQADIAVSGLSISDIDAGSAAVSVTLSVGHGTLSLATGVANGLTSGQITGNDSSSVTINAPLSAINATLTGAMGLTYTPDPNFNGNDSLRIETNDNGNSGVGGSLIDTDDKVISVTAVNDAPVVANLDGDAVIFTEGGTAVAIDLNADALLSDDTDVFVGGSLTVHIGSGGAAAEDLLSAHGGDVTLEGGAVTVFGDVIGAYAGGGSGQDLVVTFNANATQANVQELLQSLDYSNTNTLNPSTTPRAISLSLVDGGGTDNAGADTRVLHTTMNITPVDDAPSGANATRTIDEDTPYVFTADDFGFSDGDGNALLAVKITTLASHGVIKLDGLAVSAGDEIAVSNIAAHKLTFVPDANENGSPYATFTFQVKDDGAADNSSDNLDQSPNSFTLGVGAVNDAPVGDIAPGNLTLAEDGSAVVAGLSIHDIDAGDANVTVTLTVEHGTLQVKTSGISGGVTDSQVVDNGGQMVVLTASQSAINTTLADLAGLAYAPNADFNGNDNLNIIVNDGGNTGTGGEKTDTGDKAISVTAVNDAPTISGDGAESAATILEDAPSVVGQTVAALFGGRFSDAIDQVAGSSSADTLAGIAVTTNGSDPLGSWQYFDGASWIDVGPVSDTAAKRFHAATALRFNPAVDFNGAAPTLTAHLIDSSAGSFTDADPVNLSGGGAIGGTTPYSNGTVTLSQSVAAVNDAISANAPASLSSVEDTSTAVTGLLVADVDSVLAPEGVYEATLSASHGTLTLSSRVGLTFISGGGAGDATMIFHGTLAAINAALATASYAGDADYNGSDTIAFSATDTFGGDVAVGTGSATSDSKTIAVTITSVNDAPSVTNLAGDTVTFTEGGSAVKLDGGASAAIDDSDSSDFGGGRLTVSISANKVASEDQLGIAVGGAVTVSGSDVSVSGTHIGTLSGGGAGGLDLVFDLNASATPGLVSALLHEITYLNSNTADPSIAQRTIGYTLVDGGGVANDGHDTLSASSVVNVMAVNDAPTMTVPGLQTLDEDTTHNVTGITVADVDADTLAITLSVSQGTLTLGTTGSLSFALGSDGAADETMTFIGTQAALNSALATLSYAPTANFNGSDTINVTVSDNGATGDGGIKGASGAVAVTVKAVDDAPSSAADSYTTAEETKLSVSADHGVLANDTDVDGPSLNAALVTGPSHGTLTLNTDGSFDYTPDADYSGSDNFTYKASDGSFTSANTTVSLTITPSLDPVTISGDIHGDVSEDGAVAGSGLGTLNAVGHVVLFDPDGGRTAFYESTIDATYGQFHFSANGDWSYTLTDNGSPDIQQLGKGDVLDDFADIKTADQADEFRIAVSIYGTNDAPVVTNTMAGQSVAEDTPWSFAVPSNSFGDVDGDGLIYSVTLGDGSDLPGWLHFDTGTNVFSGTPPLDFHSGIQLKVTASDGASSVSDMFTLTVTATNDAPTVTVPGPQTVNEDASLVVQPIMLDDVDADTLEVTLSAGHGTLALQTTSGLGFTGGADGTAAATMTFSGAKADLTAALATLKYAPTPDYNGSDTIHIAVSDDGATGDGGTKVAHGAIAVTVNTINDAPEGTDKTVTIGEDATYSFAAADFALNDPADGNSLAAIVITTLPTHGMLTLSGDTVSAGQEILIANLSNLHFDPALDESGARYASFTFKVRDDGGAANGGVDTASAANTFIFNVSAADDAPVAVADSYTTPEDTKLAIAAAGVLGNDSDVDGPTLSAVLVTGPSHGTLTLHTDGSFDYRPTANYNGADNFTYRASDGTLTSGTTTVSLTVTAVDDAPVTVADSYTTAEGTKLSIAAAGVLSNDSDIDGPTLSAVLVTGPQHGMLTLNTNGSFDYTPTASYAGADSFTYKAGDGTVASGTTTVSLTVTAVDDAPIGLADSYTTAEDTKLSVSAAGVLTNDSDVDGPALSAVLVAGPQHGILSLNANGSFDYTPSANYSGADKFTYRASDGQRASGITTVSLTVTAVDDAPVGVADKYTTGEDTKLSVAAAGVLANDSDVDGPALSAALVAGPQHGTLTLNANGSFDYMPSANYTGSDSFTYKASDGVATSGTTTVSLTVTAIDDAPVGVSDSYTTAEDTKLSVAAAGVLANDTDVDGPALSAVLVSAPAHGTLTLNTNGSFDYIPTANYTGADSFTYKASDDTAASSTTTVSLTVTSVDDAPVAVADSYTTAEDTKLSVAVAGVLSNDSDVDGPTLSAVLVTGPQHGMLTLDANGSFDYTPTANYNGADSFTYKAGDGTATSGTTTVSLTVTAVDDAPVAVADKYTTAEDTKLSIAAAGVLANDTDVDGPVLSAVLVSGPAHGTLTLNSNGSFDYTPTANYNGTDGFTYKAGDGTLASATTTVSLTVTAADDAPIVANAIANQSSPEDTAWSFTVPANAFSDVDSASLTYSATLGDGSPLPTWLTFNAATRTFAGIPPANFNGNISLTVTASDGSASAGDSFTLIVTPVNDAPVVANAIADQSSPEDTAWSFTIPPNAFGDVDDASLSYNATLGNGSALPAWLTFNAATHSFTGTPPANFNGSLDLTVTASDGSLSASDTFTLTVAPVNDAPVVANAIADQSSPEDTDWGFIVPTNTFSDVDGTTLTYSATLANGALLPSWLVFNAGLHTFAGIPPANFDGSLDLKVTASDGALSVSDTFTLIVTPVNDGPVVANAIADQSSPEDAAWSFTIPANAFSDVDNASLSYGATLGNGSALPAWLSFDATSHTFSGTPPMNFNGNLDLKVTASDGALSASDTFTLTVSPVNDAPTAGDDAVAGRGEATSTIAASTLLVNDSDIEGETLTIAAVSNASHGVVSLNGADLSFTPDADFAGAAGFDYTVSDGHGGTATAHVSLAIPVVGTVSDGYLAGATVYADVNGNGQLDAGEPVTTSDANGGFVLPGGQMGPLRSLGGTDIDTGRLNTVQLSAPKGSTVVNPLTTLIETLVEGGASEAQAEAKVEQAFGLDANLELIKLDLVSAAAGGNAPAFAAQQAAVAVAQVLGGIVAAHGDADAAFDQLATLVDTGNAVALTAATTLGQVIAAGLPNTSADERVALIGETQQATTAVYAAHDLAGLIHIQLDAPEELGWRLFTRNGFSSEVGGTGTVFGTDGFQDIAVLDTPGTIAFDPSFNRGDDIVRLAGDADAWFIARSGSNAVLTDGDTVVSIAVGTTGMAVAFDDGARTLRYDAAAASMKIGAQSFADSFTAVTAATDTQVPPMGFGSDVLARLFLPEGGKAAIGGNIDVFGTNGAEQLTLAHGDITLDPSFNRGNDRIVIDAPAVTFTAALSGSSIALESAVVHLNIPVGTGLALAFEDDETTVTCNAQLGEVFIGSQLITATAASLTFA